MSRVTAAWKEPLALAPVGWQSHVPSSPPCHPRGTLGWGRARVPVSPPRASPRSGHGGPAGCSGLYLALPRVISPAWQEFITGRDSPTSFLFSLPSLPLLFPFFFFPLSAPFLPFPPTPARPPMRAAPSSACGRRGFATGAR